MVLDQKSLKEVMSITMVYIFNMIEILTGYLAAQLIPYTRELPWILILFPIFLTIRGATSGAFIGNLTTLLHIGTISPRIRRNSDEYYLLTKSIFIFSITNALLVSLFMSIYISDLHETLLAFIFILYVFTLVIVFSLTVTSIIGFIAYKKGLDPDVVLYPVMSTINDVMILVFFLCILTILKPWEQNNLLLLEIMPSVIVLLYYFYTLIKIKRTEIFKDIFKESYGAIIYSLILSMTSGVILFSITNALSRIPTILIILPALMTTMGDIGSIIASTFTTKLRLSGLSESTVSSAIHHFATLLPKLGLPFILFSILLSISSSLLNLNTSIILTTLVIILLTGFISSLIIGALSTLVSILAFIYGINPDNVAIPIITATADFVTIVTITVVVSGCPCIIFSVLSIL